MAVTRPAHSPPPARLPGALAWLRSLRVASPAWLDEQAWRLLVGFADTLVELLGRWPDDPDATQAARSARLLDLKRALAAHGYGAPDGSATPQLQPLLQFVCGYHDVDLRDVATIGHGRLLARHGTNVQRATWLPRLCTGALCGIAMTEPHGGTQLQATTTALTPAAGSSGRLRLDGEKCYVSRLLEAEVFVVVCRHADHGLSAVVLEPTRPGIARQPLRPAGLRGWTWGTLTFDQVPINPGDLLGRPGTAAALLAEHFAAFRPLVAATALGGAAAVVDEVLARLGQRLDFGWIRAPRDSALATLGRHAAAIHAGLLACLAATSLAAAGDPTAATWGLLVKAHGVDAAWHAAAEVGLLAGALGYQADHRIDKTRRDLDGLRYADGIHEELYRAAGRVMLTSTRANSRPHPATGLPLPTVDDLVTAQP